MDWEQVLSTLIGSFSGFLLGILSFYFTEKWKRSSQDKELQVGLAREMDYNFMLVDRWISDIDGLIRKISVNDRQVFTLFRFTDFQRLYIGACFQRGLFYALLKPEEISQLNEILTHFDFAISQWCNNFVEQWKGGTIEAAEAMRAFEFEKVKLEEFRTHLSEISEKMKANKSLQLTSYAGS